jgi:Transglycosylase SLT domain
MPATAYDGTVSRHAANALHRPNRSGPQRNAISHRSASKALDRVTFAIDGVESSHGADIAMWRPSPSGPQGPMQVSEAAADVGGGDRFDPMQNRAIGRAYLAQLYRRYHNWPDAIAAYNWGSSKVDGWVKAGRPNEKLLISVAAYTRRVLRDSGLCDDTKAKRSRRSPELADSLDRDEALAARSAQATCGYLDPLHPASRGTDRYLYNSALHHPGNGGTAGQTLSRLEQEVQSARLSWNRAVHYSSECSTTSGNYLDCKY